MKSKVAILIYSLAGGGAERVVSLLLPKLMQIYDVKLVLMNDTIEYDIPKDLQIDYLENSDAYESGLLKLLKIPILTYRYYKYCKKHSIDLSLSLLSRPNYINSLSSLFLKKRKTVISERSMASIHYSYKNLQSLVNRFLIRYTYLFADLIIANSQGNAEDLKKSFNLNKIPIKRIYNPVDIDKIDLLKRESINDFNFDDKKFNFITIGRLDKGKNHILMLKAMRHIDNANLIIIGDGILKSELNAFIDKYDLTNKVFLLGKKKNPYKYIYKSDVFVFTSNHEGFPNVLLEALACELPVISTDCQSGPREILAPDTSFLKQLSNKIENAKYGILIPTNNEVLLTKALQNIMHKHKLASLYKKEAKIRANDFNKDSIISRYIKVIDEQLQ
jgi:N-acetylgalactosamine-N,N'-diacetylbacillosaminyl-diphospho-undecaprenol 4-alpha-N-acetylgalactosaminyltransferase